VWGQSRPSAAIPGGSDTITMPGLRIDVADLLSHPGSRREVNLDEALDALAGTSARIDEPVHVAIVLERIPEGIVARGTISATWHAQCSTCLSDLDEPMTITARELFETEPIDGETYPIEGTELDLEQLVRDALLLELPLAPRCATPCAPSGAATLEPDDESASSDDAAPRDPRWAALSELEL
jgi:uncharacterized protein